MGLLWSVVHSKVGLLTVYGNKSFPAASSLTHALKVVLVVAVLVALVFVGCNPAKIERMVVASISVNVINLFIGLVAASPKGVDDAMSQVVGTSNLYGVVAYALRRTRHLVLLCPVDLSGIPQP